MKALSHAALWISCGCLQKACYANFYLYINKNNTASLRYSPFWDTSTHLWLLCPCCRGMDLKKANYSPSNCVSWPNSCATEANLKATVTSPRAASATGHLVKHYIKTNTFLHNKQSDMLSYIEREIKEGSELFAFWVSCVY